MSASTKAARKAASEYVIANRGSLRANSKAVNEAIAAVQASSRPLRTAKARVRQFANQSLPTVPPPPPAVNLQASDQDQDEGPLDLSNVQVLRAKIIRHARAHTNDWIDPMVADRLRALDRKAVSGKLTTADLETAEAFALSFAGSGALMPAAWRKLEAACRDC